MSVNSIRSEINRPKYNQSQSVVDDKIKGWQNQINKTRGKLDNLTGKNNMSPEEKKEQERQFKLEIIDLNNKISKQKTEQQKEIVSSQQAETGKTKTEAEPVKDKKVISDLNDNKAEKSAINTDENDKEVNKDTAINKDKDVNRDRSEFKTENKKEDKELNNNIDSELIMKLTNIQNEKDALVTSNRVDKNLDARQSIEKNEIRIDKRRGRDTSRRETRLENIDVDVSKIAQKYFSKNDK